MVKKKKVDMRTVPLGTKMLDKITGFEGVAIAKTEFLNGCVQYHLKARMDKDGKVREAHSFDCQQLEIVDEVKNERRKKKSPGGIMPDTPKIF